MPISIRRGLASILPLAALTCLAASASDGAGVPAAPRARAPDESHPRGPPGDGVLDLPREVARVTFGAVGDVLPHVSVKASAAAKNRRAPGGASVNHDGFDSLFTDVAKDLSATDLTFANLETPISPSGDPGAIEFHFNAPPALLASLKAAGIGLVSFANNHVFDQGPKGFAESMDELDAAGLAYAGAGRTREVARRGLRLQKNGIRIAVLGAAQFFNNPVDEEDPRAPHANKADDPEATLEAVRRARAEADFVVLAVHWGAEYRSAPRPAEVELAHQLFEAGADVVLGTHPHVLQPLERYRAADGRSCLVAYSLGNFVSNQSRLYVHGKSAEKVGEPRDGALLRFAIVKRDRGESPSRAELADVSFVPLWTDNTRIKKGGREIPEIEVVSIPRALERARGALEKLAASGAKAGAEAGEIRKRIALLERRRALIEARLGREFMAVR